MSKEQTGSFTIEQIQQDNCSILNFDQANAQAVNDEEAGDSHQRRLSTQISYQPAKSVRIMKQSSDLHASMTPARTPPNAKRQTTDVTSFNPLTGRGHQTNALKTEKTNRESTLRAAAEKAMQRALMNHPAQLMDPDSTFHKVLANRKLFSIQAPNFAVQPTAML